MPSKLDGITAAAAYAELCHNASCNTAAQGAPHLVHWEQHPAALGAQHPAAQGAQHPAAQGAQHPAAQGAQRPVLWERNSQLHRERNTQCTGSAKHSCTRSATPNTLGACSKMLKACMHASEPASQHQDLPSGHACAHSGGLGHLCCHPAGHGTLPAVVLAAHFTRAC
eukprot:1158609-Pelagomonas_calceolata.AAC.1